MEDSNLPIKRKRPRLDSGERSYQNSLSPFIDAVGRKGRSVSTEGPVDSSPELTNSPITEGRNPPTSTEVSTTTPSKVTINVREPGSVVTESPQAGSHIPGTQRDDNTNVATSTLPQAPEMAYTFAALEDRKGSTENVVDVEVSDLLDMDVPEESVTWTNLSQRELMVWQQQHFSKFPCGSTEVDWETSFRELLDSALSNPGTLSPLLNSITKWVNAYLDKTKRARTSWAKLITERSDFWGSFPTWLRFLEEPQLFRSRNNPDLNSKLVDLNTFLVVYIDLCNRMLAIDRIAMEQPEQKQSGELRVWSAGYISSLERVLSGNVSDSHWNTLQLFGVSPDAVGHRILHGDESQNTLFVELASIVQHLLARPTLDKENMQFLHLALCTPTALVPLCSLYEQNDVSEGSGTRGMHFVAFLESVDEAMEKAIKKQSTALPSDNFFNGIVHRLSELVRSSRTSIVRILSRLGPVDTNDVLAMHSEDQAALAAIVWKLDLFERCIRTGRMEVRITGLEQLQAILVEVFRCYMGSRSSNNTIHPVAKAIGNWLLRSRLIGYLLSSDSHPQIIARSANLVGFLALSERWNEEQTTSLWRNLGEMEDPHVFESVLDMFPSVIKWFKFDEIAYFVETMQEFDIMRFDFKVQSLLLNVCSELFVKAGDHTRAAVIFASSFAHLLRKSSSNRHLPLARKRELWQTSQQAFRQAASMPWPVNARLEIYKSCFEDIASKTLGTSGSCTIIRALIEYHGHQDTTILASNMDAIHLISSDFARLGDLTTLTQTNFEEFRAPVEDRLRLLEFFALSCPEKITEQVTRDLWRCMVAEHAVGPCARESAWRSLANIAKKSSTPNTFLDRCIVEHLPTLSTNFYSGSTLEFAICLRDYELSTLSQRETGEVTSSQVSSLELLWRLALGAQDDQVSAQACQALVSKPTALEEPSRMPQPLQFIERGIVEVIHVGTTLIQHLSMARLAIDTDSALARQYTRLFIMLKLFIKKLQSQTAQNTSVSYESPVAEDQPPENCLHIKYATNDRGIASEVRQFQIDPCETLGQLISRLRYSTGFSKFNAIIGGKRLDQEGEADTPLVSLGLERKGLMLLHRIPGSHLMNPNLEPGSTKPVERAILQHFDDLHDLLAAPAMVALPILGFLRAFRPPDKMLRRVASCGPDESDLLSLDLPYQAAYWLHAIESKQQEDLSGGTIDHVFLCKSIRLMASALDRLSLRSQRSFNEHQAWLAQGILRVLLGFLKEPVPLDVATGYFTQPDTFVGSLLHITGLDASSAGVKSDTHALLYQCLSVLLETCRLNSDAWSAFRDHQNSQELYKLLILSTPNAKRRSMTEHAIRSLRMTLHSADDVLGKLDSLSVPSKSTPNAIGRQTFDSFFLSMTFKIIPEAMVCSPYQCREFFDLAIPLFEANKHTLEITELQEYINLWVQILHSYEPEQNLSFDNIDYALVGIGRLLQEALSGLSQAGVCSQQMPDLHTQIFRRILFPPSHHTNDTDGRTNEIQILGTRARRALYNVVLESARARSETAEVIELLNKLLNDDQIYNVSFNFDRSRFLRAPAGYPGLENLSNTCYLNSLLTQLFMNLQFREFVLGREPVDPQSQSLLCNLQRLFTELQAGWQKSVGMKDLAKSIETYEGPLDPAIQMDADEAFNLIFDRLEGQLGSKDEREAFRRLFGGQIIQQIKSKECEHISERSEAVTAIQCDIRGKKNLQQSLDAYIEGEVMEGDNKYKCSKCDRYVNAVKRACLKDVPDNLIFHLKRFDYDLVAGTRNKVNDYFAFPDSIDMAQYTVSRLEAPSNDSNSDPFVLVGVLVHNGTAEIGHYYSYVKQHPGLENSWIEFNDTEVTRLSSESISDQCFGGSTENSFNQLFPKSWNAYMLFYQRESSFLANCHRLGPQLDMKPVDLHLNREALKHISRENALLGRTFCLFGPEHGEFVTELLRLALKIRGTQCSQSHELEDLILECVWNHIEKVFSRDIKADRAKQMLRAIEAMSAMCPRCHTLSLDWLISDNDYRIRSLLLRQPDPEFRQMFGSTLSRSLHMLKLHAPGLYYLGTESTASADVELAVDMDKGILGRATERLGSLLDIASAHFRAWPDLYAVVCQLAMAGTTERMVLHECGILARSLETLLIDSQHDWTNRFASRHNNYIRLMEKRAYDLTGLVEFIGLLLTDPMHHDTETTRLSNETRRLLCVKLIPEGADKSVPWILERAALVSESSKTQLPLDRLIRFYLDNEAVFGLQSSIVDLIGFGVVKSPAELAAPYLKMALEFVVHSSAGELVDKVLTMVTEGVRTIGTSGGAEHLMFFRRALFARNVRAFSDDPMHLTGMVLQHSVTWGVALLEYPDFGIAKACKELLDRIFFEDLHLYEDDEILADIRGTTLIQIWATISDRVNRYVRDKRLLDESKRSILGFCESCLANRASFANDNETANEDDVAELQDSLAQAYEMIATAEDLGSNAFESEDMTDVSSTYEGQDIDE